MTPTASRWTLTARITALCFAVAVVLGIIAASAAVIALNNRQQSTKVVDTWAPARLNLDNLVIALINQETSVRGYAVNNDDADLGPYRDGISAEHTAVANLRRLLAGEPALVQIVDAAEQQAEQWRSTVAEPIITDVQAGRIPQAQARVDNSARQEFDNLRATITRAQTGVAAKRSAADATILAASRHLVDLLVIAGIVVVAAGVLLFFALRLLVTRPIDRLARHVRTVSEGDFTHAIPAEGPPEVSELGAGVDVMRRKILQDLEEVRRARQVVEEANVRLQQVAEELTRSNRDLEQFAYVASHDLQEPLRKVASFCQLLQRRYAGQLDERADQYIAFAVDGAQRMQRLINDLLAFSRIGRVTSNFTDIDLNQLVANAAGHHQQRLEEAGGEVVWADLPTVRGEEPLLSALIANLVSNSVKFQRPGVAPHIEISARQDGEHWEITCADNGIGIEPEFAEKVFVIFQRLHGKEAYPGTGIGLAVAKKIVEYHGGRIWVESTPGAGTTIRFTLPVNASPAPVSPAAAPPVEEPVQ
jgi:signal transduction histidine kinase